MEKLVKSEKNFDCRSCGISGSDISTWTNLFENTDLLELIYNLTSIMIVQSTANSDIICARCYGKMMDIIDFRDKFINTQNYFTEKNIKQEYVDCGYENINSIVEAAIGTVDFEPKTEFKIIGDEEIDFADDIHIHEETDDVEDEKLVKVKKKDRDIERTKLREKEKKDKDKAGKLQCPIPGCNKFFLLEKTLTGHVRNHSGLKAYQCDLCDKSFRRERSLREHHKEKHEERDLKYVCNYPGCEKRFSIKQSFIFHQRYHEFGRSRPKQDFVCDECGRCLSSKVSLNLHKQIHANDLPYECDICGQKFRDKMAIKAHLFKHVGKADFLCEYCDYKAVTIARVNKHIKRVHKKMEGPPIPCTLCEKIFYLPQSLKRHMDAVHLNFKPHKCPYCDRCFNKKCNLKNHIAIHTGEKNQICKVCGKRFIQIPALKAHMRTHHNPEAKLPPPAQQLHFQRPTAEEIEVLYQTTQTFLY